MDTLPPHANNGKPSSKKLSFVCSYCGNTFSRFPSNVTKGAKHHFCNNTCWRAWHARDEDIPRNCKQCGKAFTILRRELNNPHRTGEFCSHSCKMAWRKGEKSPCYIGVYVERVCEACGKTFSMFPSDAQAKGAGRYCSKACKVACHPWRRHGKGYKGYTKDFPKIATSIRKRDGYQCMLCKQSRSEDGKRLRLEVHHIDHDRGNNASGNLITLCRHCHATETTCKPEDRLIWQERMANLVYQAYGRLCDKS